MPIANLCELIFKKRSSAGLARRKCKCCRAVPYCTHKRLKRSIMLRSIQNTPLLELTVFQHDAQLAAEIANGIAVQYQNERLNAGKNSINASLGQPRGRTNQIFDRTIGTRR